MTKLLIFLKASNAQILLIDYDLAPENPYPSLFNDCFMATKACIIDAERLCIETKRCILLGDSAGADIVLFVSKTFTEQNASTENSQEDQFTPFLNIIFYPTLHSTVTNYHGSFRNKKASNFMVRLEKYAKIMLYENTCMHVL